VELARLSGQELPSFAYADDLDASTTVFVEADKDRLPATAQRPTALA
jgi:hypothetical protein